MSPSAITSEPRRLSVVIPTWNGGARFQELLDALAKQDVEDGVELIVVDSGSKDGTPDRARRAGARVETIPQSEFGHGRTRNFAIGLSSGELIALLTQDAVPIGSDYLRNLFAPYALAREGPAVDACYARQFPRPDCDPILAERLRRWSASRDERVLQSFVPGDPEASRAKYEALAPLERYFACAFDNVASSVRRTTWERIPFPERSFGEDVAWARELLLSGGTVCFEPSATVEHSHRISIKREFKRLYCDHRNLMELFELRNVPSWKSVREGWKYQRNVYKELLSDLPLGALERIGWRAYSIPYALAETTAQFLGARSHWKTRESAFWRWADERLRDKV